ncbi:hypothetical protein [Quadrisphaera sp. DSM 44207]|uniref:hypothetical protein n=1 Tax=Quadrisphaera sp. DSM 44207 TaxID=1881057 RepID=UPI00088E1A48|nr:hypothetical protein [Quadrisphaera sp. DSM 44207]SDQ49799.1 hypothetical protein SAMN05428996_1938 [Quadrisphaera sp. DSM 44207]
MFDDEGRGRRRPGPPGWPAAVPPPGAEGWEHRAASWLLDLCPPEYRAQPVLVRHPVVLARLAHHHVAAQAQAHRRAVATLRADLDGAVAPGVVERALTALDHEQARLLAAVRGVRLLEEALRGRRHVPRL